MKRLFMFLALALMIVGVKAQEGIQNSKFFDNIFLDIGGGVTYSEFEKQGITNNQFEEFLSPNFYIGIGKWFNPLTAIRISGEWGKNKSFIPTNTIYYGNKESFNRVQIFGDGILNISNLLSTYTKEKAYNFSVFAGIGYVKGIGNNYIQDSHNLGVRAGIINSFKLNNTLSLNITGTLTVVDDDYNSITIDYPYDAYINLQAGLSYRFRNKDGSRYFTKIKSDTDKIRYLNDRINDQRATVDAMKSTLLSQAEVINRLQNCQDKKEDVIIKYKENIISMINFSINSYNIHSNQKATIYSVANFLKLNNNLNIYLTGYADKNTGNKNINLGLSRERVRVVRELLISYGIDSSRIIIDFFGDSLQPFIEINEFNRVVLMLLKE